MAEDRDSLLALIGVRIIRRRQELGLTQTDLANRLGIAQGNIPKIEHGERNLTIETLCKLAEALDTTVVYLVAGVGGDERS